MAKKIEKKLKGKAVKKVEIKQELVDIDGEKKIKITTPEGVKIYGL